VTIPLVEQVANLHSAQIAAVEVLGRLPQLGDHARLDVDAVRPLLTVHLLFCSLAEAEDIARVLGLGPRRSSLTYHDEHSKWSGSVADFPVTLLRVELGAGRARGQSAARVRP